MKKLFSAAAVLCLSGLVYAVVTPANTDHVAYCTGANNSNCVYRIDSSGNVTAQNITSQGTLNSSGVITATGSGNVISGATTLGASTVNTTVAGYLVFGSSQVSIIAAGTQVTPKTSYISLAPSLLAVGATVLTGAPTISTATVLGGQTAFADGQFLVVSGTSSVQALVLQDNGTLAGSQLYLGKDAGGVPNTFTMVSSTITKVFVYNASNKGWNLVH